MLELINTFRLVRGISNFDLAIAIADEIEMPKFRKQRFTAGY